MYGGAMMKEVGHVHGGAVGVDRGLAIFLAAPWAVHSVENLCLRQRPFIRQEPNGDDETIENKCGPPGRLGSWPGSQTGVKEPNLLPEHPLLEGWEACRNKAS